MMASMAELTDRDVLSMRLANLRLSLPGRSPADLVDWFGAMQAQDLASGKWSLGVRIPGSREADIDAALASGEVIRTWPMRGTIHLIHPQNARWMLELTGSRALMGLQKRWDYLGLDRQTVDRAADVLRDALRGGNRLTRGQCLDVLSDAGIDTGPGRSYHLLWHTRARNRPSFCSRTGRPSNAHLTARRPWHARRRCTSKATARRRAWTSRAGPA